MDAKFNFHKLSVPVLRSLFLGGPNLFKCLILLSFILLCCGLSLFQILERILYYTKEPSTISYRLEVMKKVRLPAVTVCPVDGFNGPLIEKEKVKRNVSSVYELLNAGLNLTDIWTLTGNNFMENVAKIHYGFRIYYTPTIWKMQFTSLGLCYILDLPNPVSYLGRGDFLGYDLINYSTAMYKVYLRDVTPDISYVGAEKDFIVVPMHINLLYYHHRLTCSENVTRKPCYNEETYRMCIVQCCDKEILRDKPCRLPFITSERSNLSLCSTPEDFRAAFPIPNEKAKTTLLNIVNECKKKCGRSCVKNQYEILKGTFDLNKQRTTTFIFPLGHNRKVVEERISYPFNALLSDVGAIIGIYIGVSLLTIFEFLEFAYFVCFFR